MASMFNTIDGALGANNTTIINNNGGGGGDEFTVFQSNLWVGTEILNETLQSDLVEFDLNIPSQNYTDLEILVYAKHGGTSAQTDAGGVFFNYAEVNDWETGIRHDTRWGQGFTASNQPYACVFTSAYFNWSGYNQQEYGYTRIYLPNYSSPTVRKRGTAEGFSADNGQWMYRQAFHYSSVEDNSTHAITTMRLKMDTGGAGRFLKAGTYVVMRGWRYEAVVTDVVGGGANSSVTVNNNYAISETDTMIFVSANCTLTMPPPSSNRKVTIKLLSTNVTIVPNGGELVEGSSSLIINIQYTSVTLASDGVNWWIV